MWRSCSYFRGHTLVLSSFLILVSCLLSLQRGKNTFEICMHLMFWFRLDCCVQHGILWNIYIKAHFLSSYYTYQKFCQHFLFIFYIKVGRAGGVNQILEHLKWQTEFGCNALTGNVSQNMVFRLGKPGHYHMGGGNQNSDPQTPPPKPEPKKTWPPNLH